MWQEKLYVLKPRTRGVFAIWRPKLEQRNIPATGHGRRLTCK